MLIEPIARFRSPFSSKFGIPKQSGMVKCLEGTIVFEPKYRNPDMIRGLDGFDYIWMIWEFSTNKHEASSPVVRPPVLGGNEKVGVFATRSPFRPNRLGLSSVRIARIRTYADKGTVIDVIGADLMDGTPIYDIKPYVCYADCHEGVRCGFVDSRRSAKLEVRFAPDVRQSLTETDAAALAEILSLDPRPRYHHNPEKTYGMPFSGYDVHFRVDGDVLTVVSLS